MDNMYRENILDHGMNMRNRGLLDPADVDHEEHNHTCGDRLRLTLQVDADGVIRAVGWDGSGCAISQAAASMLGEEILGKSLSEVKHISRQDILEMLGIPISLNRMKCAMLGFKTLIIGSYGLVEWERIDEDED